MKAKLGEHSCRSDLPRKIIARLFQKWRRGCIGRGYSNDFAQKNYASTRENESDLEHKEYKVSRCRASDFLPMSGRGNFFFFFDPNSQRKLFRFGQNVRVRVFNERTQFYFYIFEYREKIYFFLKLSLCLF